MPAPAHGADFSGCLDAEAPMQQWSQHPRGSVFRALSVDSSQSWVSTDCVASLVESDLSAACIAELPDAEATLRGLLLQGPDEECSFVPHVMPLECVPTPCANGDAESADAAPTPPRCATPGSDHGGSCADPEAVLCRLLTCALEREASGVSCPGPAGVDRVDSVAARAGHPDVAVEPLGAPEEMLAPADPGDGKDGWSAVDAEATLLGLLAMGAPDAARATPPLAPVTTDAHSRDFEATLQRLLQQPLPSQPWVSTDCAAPLGLGTSIRAPQQLDTQVMLRTEGDDATTDCSVSVADREAAPPSEPSSEGEVAADARWGRLPRRPSSMSCSSSPADELLNSSETWGHHAEAAPRKMLTSEVLAAPDAEKVPHAVLSRRSAVGLCEAGDADPTDYLDMVDHADFVARACTLFT